ncbi:MAG: hypothetical protein WC838_00895 [Candidatus Margulisiibacteriota bacterium]
MIVWDLCLAMASAWPFKSSFLISASLTNVFRLLYWYIDDTDH